MRGTNALSSYLNFDTRGERDRPNAHGGLFFTGRGLDRSYLNTGFSPALETTFTSLTRPWRDYEEDLRETVGVICHR